jgi:hypothetical protein
MMLSEEDGCEAAAPGSANHPVPWTAAARYDRKSRRIVVLLSNGLEFSIPVKLAQGLAGESACDLEDIEISPTGLVLHWPKAKTDLYLPAVLNEVFGPPQNRWDAFWSRWQDKPQRSRSESEPWHRSHRVVTQLIRKLER